MGGVGNLEASTAGNGSLIRLAPTAIFRRHSLSASWWESVTQSGVTHGAVEVQDCCKLFAAQLHLALNGADKHEALAPKVRPLQPRPMVINAGEYKQKSREQIRSSGYVVDTLEAALWAVWNTDNYESPESPTPDIDLWDVMDAWISIFLENADADADFQP